MTGDQMHGIGCSIRTGGRRKGAYFLNIVDRQGRPEPKSLRLSQERTVDGSDGSECEPKPPFLTHPSPASRGNQAYLLASFTTTDAPMYIGTMLFIRIGPSFKKKKHMHINKLMFEVL